MGTDPELWRGWLKDPVITRAAAEPAAARRRGVRAQRTRGARTDRPESSGSTAGRRVGFAAVLIMGVGAVIAAVAIAGTGEPDGGGTARPYAVVTTSASALGPPNTSAGPPPFCVPGTVGSTIVTNTSGDRASGPGVIAAYEHAFFVARDPRAALDVTDRGPGLPGEPQLAQGIAAVPVGAPWCVSVTEVGAGMYETAVRYLPAPGQPPVLWLLNITVAENGGLHTIVRIEDKA